MYKIYVYCDGNAMMVIGKTPNIPQFAHYEMVELVFNHEPTELEIEEKFFEARG
jgi:hypothetical protein